VERLISVLNEHRERNRKIDPVIESERYYFIRRRLALRDIGQKKYLTESQPRPPQVPLLGNLLWSFGVSRLSPFGRRYHRVNAEGFKQLASDWKSAKRPRQETGRIGFLAKRASSRKGTFYKSQKFQADAWDFAVNLIGGLTPNEIDDCVQAIETRYAQICAACQLPDPESTVALGRLNREWTTDESWKKSPLTLLYAPHLLPQRSYRRLDTNAWLCLAAIRKWQIEHEEKNPSDLTEVLEAAGIRTPVLDPFSGKQLVMREFDHKMMIHSVGPDGVDTNGKKVLRRSRRRSEFTPIRDDATEKESQKGDICFELWISNGTRSR
jgi:hypothetical protein